MTRNERLIACERSIDAVIEELEEIAAELGVESIADRLKGDMSTGELFRAPMDVMGSLKITSVVLCATFAMYGVKGVEDERNDA